MSEITLGDLFTQYNRSQAYELLEQHNAWFAENRASQKLNDQLQHFLEKAFSENRLKQYDFALLVLQAVGIHSRPGDRHFELLFRFADEQIDQACFEQDQEFVGYLLHQLMDVSMHYGDEIEQLFTAQPKLAERVLRKIGQMKYQPESYGPNMYFAAYKALWLFRFLPQPISRELLETVFLKHFDKRVKEDAKGVE